MAVTAPDAAEPGQQAHIGGDNLSCALALGSAIGVSAIAAPGWVFTAATAATLALASVIGMRRSRDAAALSLAAATLVAIRFLPAVSHLAPAPLFLALGALLFASRLRAPWLARGEFSRAVAVWVVATVVLSGIALVAWWGLARPDISDLTLAAELRHAVTHPAILAAAIAGWSALNAVAEEFFFRGALQHALTRSLGPGLGVAVQAVAFGVFHYRGFPRGWSGVALATIYGLILGALRQRARGLLAPWAAHVAADLVIATILLMVAR